MKNETNIFLAIIFAIAAFGMGAAFIGIIISTVQIMKESVQAGLVVCFLDLVLVLFVSWVIKGGIIDMIKKIEK